MRFLIAFIAVLAIPAVAISKTINVPGDYNTIQEAIYAASNGDTVLVDPGIYVENIDFKGKAITVTSEHGPDVTIIDGGHPKNPDSGSVVTFDSEEGPDSVLEGFTLFNGSGTRVESNPMYWQRMGGGIFSGYSCSPIIRNNSIQYNHCDYGGGIYCSYGSPVIVDNEIMKNEAHVGGGLNCDWIYETTVSGNIIVENKAQSGGGFKGGGIYVAFTDNVISNNIADVGGGISASGYIKISNNMITLNSATSKGGGILWHGEISEIYNNTISWNVTGGNGGGIYYYHGGGDVKIENNIVSLNLAAKRGGGIYIKPLTKKTIANNTLFGNTASEGGGFYCEDCKNFKIMNMIFWDNTAGYGTSICSSGSTLYISYSDIKKDSLYFFSGGVTWEKGIIETDPLFIDPLVNDFHLRFTSPCMNSGTNSAPNLLDVDFEGDPRIAHGTVDMGADEFYSHLYWTGDGKAGQPMELKIIGLPGTTPVGLCIGSGVLDPPIPSMWGDWYLQFPIVGPLDLGPIPLDGFLTNSWTPPAPLLMPMQTLVGAELTNLCLIKVQ